MTAATAKEAAKAALYHRFLNAGVGAEVAEAEAIRFIDDLWVQGWRATQVPAGIGDAWRITTGPAATPEGARKAAEAARAGLAKPRGDTKPGAA